MAGSSVIEINCLAACVQLYVYKYIIYVVAVIIEIMYIIFILALFIVQRSNYIVNIVLCV